MIHLFHKRRKITPQQVFGIDPIELIQNSKFDYSMTSLVLNIELENNQKQNEELFIWKDKSTSEASNSIILQAQIIQDHFLKFGTFTIKPAFLYELTPGLKEKIFNLNVQLVNNKYLLLKYPIHFSTFESQLIFLAQALNFKPLIILPKEFFENFVFLKDKSKINRLMMRGCHFHMNYLNFTGHYGVQGERLTRYLLDAGMVSMLGIKFNELSMLKEQQYSLVSDKYAQLILKENTTHLV